MTNTRTATWTRSLAATIAGAALIVGVAGPAAAQGDVSHRSRYGQAVYAASHRNTRVVVATGWNDPASGPVTKSLEVDVTQKWCDGNKLIERELSGSSNDYFGKTNPKYSYTTSVAQVRLNGTETRTPAGPKCAEPQTESATTKDVAFDSLVISDVRGTGPVESYSRDDGGEYTYQNATASGAFLMSEWGAWFGFEREAREPGETWLWEGYWADVTGVDVESLVPQTDAPTTATGPES